MTERGLLICAVVSVAAHFVIARALEELPARPRKPPPRVTIQVVDVPRPPEPPPPAPKSEPEPTPTRVAPSRPSQQRSRPVKSTITKTVTTNTAEPSTSAVTVESSADDEPVYSATMQSASSGGSTPGPVGSSTRAGGTGTAPASGTADVVPTFETTKMPLPQGQCFGKYTDEARTSGVEGTVVLDLTVGEDGHTRDIRVMQGLPHGLSEAAVAALRDCKFSPGEKAGKRVPVRIRGFKIQFVLAEAR